MVKKQSLISIRFSPTDPGRAFERIIPEFQKQWKREMNDFSKVALKRVREVIPTGQRRRTRRQKATRDTVKVITSLNDNKLNGTIRIEGSQVIRFLDKGTRRSPGRYIPGLHRRLRQGRPNIGYHPGIRGLNIIQEAKNDIENDAKDTIRNLQNRFKFSIRTAFRT